MESLSSSPDIAQLVSQLESLREDTFQNDDERKELYNKLRDVSFRLEAPEESIKRIAYAPLQLILGNIAIELGLFEILTKKSELSTSILELAEETETDPVLLARIMRYFAGQGMVIETQENMFTASNITKAFVPPGLKAGMVHNLDVMLPCWQNIPKFLAETNYKNPDNIAKCPFQLAHNTNLTAFSWAQTQPSKFATFNTWMAASHGGSRTWLDVYSFTELYRDVGPTTPMFVDVGGGIGTQCIALKTKFPKLVGRIILQDLSIVLTHAIPTEGVELMPHDLWSEQPIKGARMYYLRNILHDYTDSKCIELLSKIIPAMGQGSMILIDDMIVPNTGADWKSSQLDIALMACLASMERTERQWYELLDSAGLHVRGIYTYNEQLRDSIIEVVPK